MKKLGRPVMGGDMIWDFVREEEFQRRQEETLAYLEKRREAQSRDGELKENLHLQAELTEIMEGGGHGLRLELQMRGGGPLEVSIAGKVGMTAVTPGEEKERVSKYIRTFRRAPDQRSVSVGSSEKVTIFEYSDEDGPKISSDSMVRARCWVNSIGSTEVRDSVVLMTTASGRGLH